MTMTDPYTSGVLVEAHHERLVADMAHFARDAGIQPHWLSTSMIGLCAPEEIAYLKKFNQTEKRGLCYLGKSKLVAPVDKRMSALTAALVRNFIRARMMTLSTVLEILKYGEEPDATCLLIPNFFFKKEEGGAMSAWHPGMLLDLLYARQADGLHTVIAVSSWTGLDAEYGTAFCDFITENFQIVKA
jgi:hypothetical protein